MYINSSTFNIAFDISPAYIIVFSVLIPFRKGLPWGHPVDHTGQSNQPEECLTLVLPHLYRAEYLLYHCKTGKMSPSVLSASAFPEMVK